MSRYAKSITISTSLERSCVWFFSCHVLMINHLTAPTSKSCALIDLKNFGNMFNVVNKLSICCDDFGRSYQWNVSLNKVAIKGICVVVNTHRENKR